MQPCPGRGGIVDDLMKPLGSVLHVGDFVNPEIFVAELIDSESKRNAKDKTQARYLFQRNIHNTGNRRANDLPLR
jgi:hypothetical protein